MKVLSLKIKGHDLVLHPYGALFWKEKKALLIADLHIGKISHFRKEGLAVPQAAQNENIDKLNVLIDEFHPLQIYFLGDLFHSTKNKEWDIFVNWMTKQTAKIDLIMGNHDLHDIKSLQTDSLNRCDEKIIGEFHLTHHPTETKDLFNICGHIHPSVILRGKGKVSAKAACFAHYENGLILPAFGAFTGTHKIDLKSCLHLYATTEDEVIQVK